MRTKILTLGLISLLLLGSVFSADKKRQVNFWEGLFKEPIEIIYMIMKDGTPLRHTSNSEIAVYTSIEKLEKGLKSLDKSYRIKDIAIFIHNHFRDSKFSLEDRRLYEELKTCGFDGLFLLYSHMTNKTYDIEDEEKSK